jgi:hypothetical protein
VLHRFRFRFFAFMSEAHFEAEPSKVLVWSVHPFFSKGLSAVKKKVISLTRKRCGISKKLPFGSCFLSAGSHVPWSFLIDGISMMWLLGHVNPHSFSHLSLRLSEIACVTKRRRIGAILLPCCAPTVCGIDILPFQFGV